MQLFWQWQPEGSVLPHSRVSRSTSPGGTQSTERAPKPVFVPENRHRLLVGYTSHVKSTHALRQCRNRVQGQASTASDTDKIYAICTVRGTKCTPPVDDVGSGCAPLSKLRFGLVTDEYLYS